MTPDEFQTQFKQALTAGDNDVMQVLMDDIDTQVPILTGRLKNSYRVSPATPDKLQASIDGGTDYGGDFYPFMAEFGRRNSALPPVQRLFAAPGAKERREIMCQKKVEARIQALLD
mgnify:FL=1